MAGYIFGGNTGETPETLARKRALVARIMGQGPVVAPRNNWDGLGNAFASITGGIAARSLDKEADASERAGQAAAGDLRQQLINSMMGQSSFPAAPNPGNTSSMATMPAGESADYIRSGLQQRGLPSHVADAFVLNMQDESGLNPGINERNPIVPGSRGGFGLYQLTGPRRRAYEAFAAQRGVDPSDVDAQLDFLVTELQGPEARAAQSILSAPDTGTAAQAIVNDFLRPAPEHRQRRASRYAAYQGQPAASGLDAVNALGAAQPVPVAETEADILAQEQAMAAQDPMAFAAQGAMPEQQAAPMQQAQQPMQVAQAGGFPEMAGHDPSRPPPPDLGMLMQVLSNPFMDDGTKAYAQAVLNQHMQAQDPSHQLDMDYRRAQIEKLNREAAGGNRRFGLNPIYGTDPQTGQTVLGVLGDDGSFKPVDTGGVDISTGVDRVDLGTHFGLLDKRSGQMVGTLPKENYQEAFDTTSGANDAKSAAEARTNLPKVEDNANAIIGMIESLSTDPYLDSMVGPVASRLPNVSADAARVQSKMDQIGGQAFLQAFETLRGGGTISNVEGQKAADAIARLNTAQSPADYRAALEELSTIVRTSLDRARRSAGMGSGTNAPPGADGWQDMGGVRIRRKQ